MAAPRPKAEPGQKRKAGILGVHPVLAALAAIALVFAGIVFGAWLNVTARDEKPVARNQPITAPKPNPNVRPPVVENLDQTEATPSLFAPKPGPDAAVQAPTSEEPEVAEDAPSPALDFGVASNAPKDQPVIAIVIDDMGLDRTRGQKALDLPGPLTLSFLTYANDLPAWSERARKAGHEVMAHVPMEPISKSENPGPKALLMSQSPAQSGTQLAALLDPWTGYVGINNHMGSKFTADKEHMAVVIAALKARGLLWLDSKTTGSSVGTDMARAAGVPAVDRDVFLDNVQTEAKIREELAKAEQLALQRGTAIAIGHPHEVTIKVLREWLGTLPAKGIALVPLTEVARRQGQLKN